ncbi:MAG: hypothetical protein JSV05_03430 [Candidatus Bathyarchaeota archaeon]|nr:MAG: hypothetical protein JSV05_03430 [Candidatus Bathyarchaeota archaeon]
MTILIMLLVGTLVLSVASTFTASSKVWQASWMEITTGSEPVGRATHSAVWDSQSNQMIVFGGHYTSSLGSSGIGLKDTWMYNSENKIWTQGANAPMTRGEHTAVWDTDGNQMIIHGGESVYGSYQYYQDTWVYSPTTDTWTQKANGPCVRAWAPGVWDPTHAQMIIFGGYYRPSNNGLRDTWVYVPTTDTWTAKADGPAARWAHMAVWDTQNNEMLIFGGVSQSGWFTDTWAYNPAQDQWDQRADMPSILAQASAVWNPIDDVVVVFGGEHLEGSSNVPTDETWIYDPSLDVWTVLDPDPHPYPTGWLQAVHVWDTETHQMLVFGGVEETAPNHYTNKLWSLTLGVAPITVSINIEPRTLNIFSCGNWITTYIELPEGYDVNNIDVSTIMLNDTISAELYPTEVGDYDSDGVPDLMVKFSRAEVINYIQNAIPLESKFVEATLTITGSITDGPSFIGTDVIKAIWKDPKMH